MKRPAAVRLFPIAVALALAAALVAPGAGLAATVVNGGFESGNFEGWSVYRATGLGDWYVYQGTAPPIGGKQKGGVIPAPPQGSHAAITDEYNPDTVILYQDVVLRPGYEHRLNLLAFYVSGYRPPQEPIEIPTPDTLSVDDAVLGDQTNQQYRIDVMRPEAPLESIAPGDVLATVFQTRRGGPEAMQPTQMLANLTPFAGQTVRLRVAVAAHEETLNGGVDAVSVESAPPGELGPPPGRGGGKGGTRLGFGKVKANPKNGTAILPVKVPGAGKLTAQAKKLIKPASAQAAAARTLKLHLAPTASALATLREKHKLRVKLAVAFAPRSGAVERATFPVVLKLQTPQHRGR